MNKISLYPKVNVYQNSLSDPKKFIDLLKKSETFTEDNYFFKPWEDWYGFGSFMNIGMPNPSDVLLLTTEDEYEKTQKDFIEEIRHIFFNYVEQYKEEWDFNLPNWHPNGISICKYDETKNHHRLAMNYHTDYNGWDKHKPGLKYGVTCTIYINDDYVGGGISFLDQENGDVIDYKPKAGDVLMFPSAEPYYHGVAAVKSGQKYLVRLFWSYYDEGSKEWQENEKKYGKEKWAQMEQDRYEKEKQSGILNNKISLVRVPKKGNDEIKS